MIYGQFGVASSAPLPGGVRLSDFVKTFEADPGVAGHLVQARKSLAAAVEGEIETIRALRLRMGLSQALLAERAKTQQSYIARLEAGTVDPGTEMIDRLADALGLDPVRVFAAVRRQRSRSDSSHA